MTCSLWDFILSLQVLLVCLVCWLFFSPLFKVQLSPKAQFLALLNSHFSLYDLLFSLGFHHRPFTLMICSYKYMPLSLPPILKARIVSASILQCSALFIVQLSHPYMTTGKTIALNRWMFFGQIMSLLFNMLSRFVIDFLPRSKGLLISWLQSPYAAKENKVCRCFHCFPIYLPWSDGTGCHDFSFFNGWVLSQFFTLLFHFHQEAL